MGEHVVQSRRNVDFHERRRRRKRRLHGLDGVFGKTGRRPAPVGVVKDNVWWGPRADSGRPGLKD